MLVERGRGDQVGLDKLPHSLSLVQCTTSRAVSWRATGLPAPPARHGGAQWLAGPWTEPSIDLCSSCCCRPRLACLPHPPTVRTRASSWQETSWQQSHPHRTRAIQVRSIEVSPEMDGEGKLILDKTLN